MGKKKSEKSLEIRIKECLLAVRSDNPKIHYKEMIEAFGFELSPSTAEIMAWVIETANEVYGTRIDRDIALMILGLLKGYDNNNHRGSYKNLNGARRDQFLTESTFVYKEYNNGVYQSSDEETQEMLRDVRCESVRDALYQRERIVVEIIAEEMCEVGLELGCIPEKVLEKYPDLSKESYIPTEYLPELINRYAPDSDKPLVVIEVPSDDMAILRFRTEAYRFPFSRKLLSDRTGLRCNPQSELRIEIYSGKKALVIIGPRAFTVPFDVKGRFWMSEIDGAGPINIEEMMLKIAEVRKRTDRKYYRMSGSDDIFGIWMDDPDLPVFVMADKTMFWLPFKTDRFHKYPREDAGEFIRIATPYASQELK